ncbi:MAG TPA: hypothetical protein DEB09_03410 [Candidatus Magasanikbacteria bacterium]|nr:hypothetical protein [Candidatus Magasanikbacteria bacterium]
MSETRRVSGAMRKGGEPKRFTHSQRGGMVEAVESKAVFSAVDGIRVDYARAAAVDDAHAQEMIKELEAKFGIKMDKDGVVISHPLLEVEGDFGIFREIKIEEIDPKNGLCKWQYVASKKPKEHHNFIQNMILAMGLRTKEIKK